MSAKYPERFGIALVFSPINSAWLLMWKDQVLRIISDEKEAAAEYERLQISESGSQREWRATNDTH